MANFTRETLRFFFRGLNVNAPPDALPTGKFPGPLLNIRGYQDGTIQPRQGTTRVTGITGGVTTLARLNDPTPFNQGVPAVRFGASGGILYGGLIGQDPLPAIDAGFDSNPLHICQAQPVGTTQPWIYFADRLRQRKTSVNLVAAGLTRDTGIPQPNTEPQAVLAAPGLKVIDDFEYTGTFMPWIATGSFGAVPTLPASITRVNSTSGVILFDAGNTGNASVAIDDMSQIGIGSLLTIGGQTVMVEDVRLAVVDTSIAAILYDNNAGPGICTIQPLASLGTGSINATSYEDYVRFHYGITGTDIGQIPLALAPPSLKNPVTTVGFRDLDFPVNCLVQIGTEWVRILSAAIGPDGIQSFRCRTNSVHVVGEPLIGHASIRVFLPVNVVAPATVITHGIQQTISLATGLQNTVYTVQAGGIRTGAPFPSTTPPGGSSFPIPDHTDVVAAAKAYLIGLGTDLTGPCGGWAIVNETVKRLAFEGAGLLIKTTGNNCDGFSTDVLCYPDGHIFDILSDPGGANTPQWLDDGFVDPSRYAGSAPNPNPVPPPGTGPSGPGLSVDLSTIAGLVTRPEDEIHLSIRIDNMSIVQEVRIYFDVDATVNDFTRNVYFFVWSQNDLINAIQANNVSPVTPVIDQQQGTVVPRDQTRQQNTNTPDPVVQQLALGNNQWIELRARVGDLQRIGTDTSRSLANVQAAEITVQANFQPGFVPGGASTPVFTLQVAYDAFLLTGGHDPDVGQIGTPYYYAYRYRASESGAKSNMAPLSRTGVLPRRQRVILSATQSPDPQVDKVDWFRIGATLTDLTYVGTSDNDNPPVFNDDFGDAGLRSNELGVFDDFQPWPTHDVPRKGLCNVSGSAIQRISGDAFDGSWAYGSQILIDGIATTLYRSPTSPNFLEIVENAGARTNVTFELPSATILNSKFATLWGPFEGTYFSVGDRINPGQLTWTKRNNPDNASDKSTLYVCSPNTPLQNGYIWDGLPYVASTEDIYRILPDPAIPGSYRTELTPAGRGFWSVWGNCNTPFGEAFWAKDGIYLTAGGARAVSLTDQDLYPLFPHDDVPGKSISGIDAPDMAQDSKLRLTYADGYLFADYVALGVNEHRTLIYEFATQRWMFDHYNPTIQCRNWEEGEGLNVLINGHDDGAISQYGGTSDLGNHIDWTFRVPDVDGGDPRVNKTLGDLIVDLDPAGGVGVSVTVGYNDFQHTLPAQVIGAGSSGRQPIIVDVVSGLGLIARNFGIVLAGSDVVLPICYLWQLAWVPKVEDTALRATDWEDAGYFGAKWMQGVLIEADTGGQSHQVQIQYDDGSVGDTFVINDSLQDQTPHSFPKPFIGHLVRIVSLSPTPWRFYRARWVWEPSPELVSDWVTQPTTKDFPGYNQDERVLVAHISTIDFDLQVTADGRTMTHRIANSGGAFVKTEVLLPPNKGKAYQYAIHTVGGVPGVRLFLKDCSVYSKGWGQPGPYGNLRVFGDLSRENGGARI